MIPINPVSYLKRYPDRITLDICFAAIERDHDYFKSIPIKFKTRELCLQAVKYYSLNLMRVPEEMLTESFYIDAVQLNSVVISRIPTAHKTVAICNAVEFNWSVGWFPPPSHSPAFYDMWKALIVKHKDAYGYIREPTTDELTQLYKLIWGL